VADGDGGVSNPFDLSVTVTAVNDAPGLNTSPSPTLDAIAEDATSPAGTAIAQLLAA